MASTSTSLAPMASVTEAATGGRRAWLVARQKINVEATILYAVSVSALIGVFILTHIFRHVAVRFGLTRSRNVLLLPLIATTRAARRIFVRHLPGFTSTGHALLVVTYVALNLVFSLYRIDHSRPTDLCSRFGWMATANMVLVVFLALKNTPLAILTAYSYERLNVLHQISGYTTLIYTILHGCIYSAYFINGGRVEVLHEDVVTAGIVLGFALLFSVLAGMILRRFNYELFYIVHVVLFIVIAVTLGLHRPSFEHDQGLYAVVVLGALWFGDRLIRLCRLVYNSVNNEANVYALPNGGTRIVLKKPLLRARPGKHCYVWLPRIRAFETHPFTIVSSNPMELVINTYSGFTRDLHKYALENPAADLKVSVEGPYGTIPDPLEYDKVVLVAGGSGATFTFGMAADMLGRMTEDSQQRIDFIWAVKKHDNLTWFTQHLSNLRSHTHAPKVALKVHITNFEPAASSNTLEDAERAPGAGTLTEVISKSGLERGTDSEYPTFSAAASSTATRYDSDKEERDMGQRSEVASSTSSVVDLPIIAGRPDTETEIKNAVQSLTKNQRVLIAACGPDSLTTVVRNVAASCISVNGPGVEVHCEQFGW
ncbi:ferric reductase NAD binding domain-containing protein [Durotheca rogersii]|uniref:ferric reductase NAD binding domain-containing protein n=1 Tax=Durotheca rogersii TaxID=419775 RepID=UPI00221E7ECB|nr:ferric reductase NAD binding domain-containing protein [Durotheca rogersii]KAI5855005.1 ferric reductase NAD binding domain-containing protein [Durotheca rogersii]